MIMLVVIWVVLESFMGYFGIGQIWVVGKGLHLMNVCLQKRKNNLITFRLGEMKTMIGYIFVNSYRSSFKDVKVITGEELVS